MGLAPATVVADLDPQHGVLDHSVDLDRAGVGRIGVLDAVAQRLTDSERQIVHTLGPESDIGGPMGDRVTGRP
jgi:hypothetical protein